MLSEHLLTSQSKKLILLRYMNRIKCTQLTSSLYFCEDFVKKYYNFIIDVKNCIHFSAINELRLVFR